VRLDEDSTRLKDIVGPLTEKGTSHCQSEKLQRNQVSPQSVSVPVDQGVTVPCAPPLLW
jgi:hypothetical protein